MDELDTPSLETLQDDELGGSELDNLSEDEAMRHMFEIGVEKAALDAEELDGDDLGLGESIDPNALWEDDDALLDPTQKKASKIMGDPDLDDDLEDEEEDDEEDDEWDTEESLKPTLGSTDAEEDDEDAPAWLEDADEEETEEEEEW